MLRILNLVFSNFEKVSQFMQNAFSIFLPLENARCQNNSQVIPGQDCGLQ